MTDRQTALGSATGYLAQMGFSDPNALVVQVQRDLGPFLLSVAGAILILVAGWIVAAIAASLTQRVLKRTAIDNQIATWITGEPSAGSRPPRVEKWAASIVFWIVIIFTLIAVLQTLQLSGVSQPLQSLLDQIIGFVPKLAGAALLLAAAWILATIAKLILTRTLEAAKLDERLGEQVGEDGVPAPYALTQTISNVVYWFIFLLFLPAVLNTLQLQGTLQPVQQLLNEILLILPNIFAAILISFVGWLLAQIVRRIVMNLLAAAGADQLSAKFGLNSTATSPSFSWIVGAIVYVLILIPTAISALEALRISAISQPAIAMLNTVLGTLPQIFTAVFILIVAYMIGQFVAELVTNVLTGMGFNNLFSWLGLQPSRSRSVSLGESQLTEVATSPTDTVSEATSASPAASPQQTPSEVVGVIVRVAILLFATVAAVDILNIAALTTLVSGIIVIAGRILAGLVVFAIGLYLANLAYTLIVAGAGSRQANILGQTARIAILIFTGAMALQQMGVAPNIVNLAFGLLLGAVAVAIALAFGLGGRDIAAEQIRAWIAFFKQQQ
ncbi:mechanosensitive ion channel [Trichothermofontia sp.]